MGKGAGESIDASLPFLDIGAREQGCRGGGKLLSNSTRDQDDLGRGGSACRGFDFCRVSFAASHCVGKYG